jgi:hypothetical protein
VLSIKIDESLNQTEFFFSQFSMVPAEPPKRKPWHHHKPYSSHKSKPKDKDTPNTLALATPWDQ